jgi:hypothetical protein
MDLGCFDRMVVIPYIMTKQKTNRHAFTTYVDKTIPSLVSHNKWVSRPYPLVFVGTQIYGTHPILERRTEIVHDLDIAFFCQDTINPDKAYQQGKYALVLRGTTPTRRAFYQAIANGCFPIVPSIAGEMYSNLFRGSLDLEGIMLVTDDYTQEGLDRLITLHQERDINNLLDKMYHIAKQCDYFDEAMVKYCLVCLT